MHRRSAPVLAAAFLVAIGAALVAPAVALAHAELLSSEPADGSTVGTDPGTISATFSETIDPGRSSMELRSPSGQTVATGTVDASQTSMTLSYPALDPGTYTVRWTTVTPDDNGVERGTFTIVVAAAPASPAASASAAAPASPGASGSPGASTASMVPVDIAVSPSPAPSTDPGSAANGSNGLADVLLPIVVVVLVVGGLLLLLRRRAAA